jgi:hypothetical protein
LKAAIFHRIYLTISVQIEAKPEKIFLKIDVEKLIGRSTIPQKAKREVRQEGPKETIDMQYLLLIYGNEAQWDTKSEADRNAMLAEFSEFTKSIAQSGHLRGGNELNVTSTATTVRVRDKKRVVTDGPFAETKEQLGGYYLVEAKDLDEAIGIAARIPSARMGSIEVRPIIPHDMP